jgi:hypothetical protein
MKVFAKIARQRVQTAQSQGAQPLATDAAKTLLP